MKKVILGTALIGIIGLTGAYQASAYMGHGGMRGDGDCPGYMQANAQLDDATREKLDKFHNDNQEIRKAMFVKRAEIRALMNAQVPDSTKIAALSGELFDLRTNIRDKAKAEGLSGLVGAGHGCGGGCEGRGPRRGGDKM